MGLQSNGGLLAKLAVCEAAFLKRHFLPLEVPFLFLLWIFSKIQILLDSRAGIQIQIQIQIQNQSQLLGVPEGTLRVPSGAPPPGSRQSQAGIQNQSQIQSQHLGVPVGTLGVPSGAPPPGSRQSRAGISSPAATPWSGNTVGVAFAPPDTLCPR